MDFKDKAIGLYSSGMSASQVARACDISMGRVYKLLSKNGVNRRTPAQSNHINFSNKLLTFQTPEIGKMTGFQKELWTAGLFIYLGEGSKRNSSTVDVANADPSVIKIFLRMLREIYHVDERRFRIYLYCHSEDTNPLINYWSKMTKIPRSQFTKPYIKAGLEGAKSDKMLNGLVHVRYSDKKLWQHIMQDMNLKIEKLLE